MTKKIDSDYQMDEVLGTYRLDGSMLRAKSRVLLEDWIERIYPRMQDETTPTSALLDIGKTLIELGDMKPKTNAQPVNQGPGFSITINIPQPDGKEPIVIEGTAHPTDTIDEDAIDEPLRLSPTTKSISVPDFSLSADDVDVDDLDD